ncbi:hypothetical protein AB1K70_23380 [Bremerella sp. JC770]|uniref:hypothetical protein n=1 Tax=Bremerella sp. JC770 TaxID=3232137 RepID=UPI0034591F6E
MKSRYFCLVLALTSFIPLTALDTVHAEAVRIATFQVDASPPIGSMLAYVPTKGVEAPLSFRGVIIDANETYVLCAVDWIGVSSESQTRFKKAIAEAVGTEPEYVLVHALHQHDAPRCDETTLALLREFNLPTQHYDGEFIADVRKRAAAAAKHASAAMTVVTHLGTSEAEIEKVASNRRILGEDGKVKYVRYTATADPAIRAHPVGVIDPMCKAISFWNEDKPLVVMTYYATHPQSYYRTGLANPDFPGIARNMVEQESGTFHIHFNGAGGNIGAGKWNDGAHKNRMILANRVADGMREAFQTTKRIKLEPSDVSLASVDVQLPINPHVQESELLETLNDPKSDEARIFVAARYLAWLRRCEAEDKIAIQCLNLGPARVMHMPGELFVEYQLAAQQMRPDLFVAMAAYGDYAPGYIGTEVSYSQGGYETSVTASRVSSRVEKVLFDAMHMLLMTDSPPNKD